MRRTFSIIPQMKSTAFLLFSFLLLLPLPLSACWPPTYEPQEYLMYRGCYEVAGMGPEGRGYNYDSDANCRLWQQQTRTSASLAEIYRVVYKASVEEVAALLKPATSSASRQIDTNAFARTLRTDPEAANLLLLAKQCEAARERMASPWYYPSKHDSLKLSLEQIAGEAQNYSGTRFKSRYALQAERALLSLRRYDECINYWNSVKRSLPDDALTRMALRYVAGAYYNIGETETAKQLYGRAGDVESLLNIARKEGMGAIDAIYAHYPEAPELRNWMGGSIRWSEVHGDRDGLPSEREKCLKIAQEGRVSDPAFWYYSAAFIDYLLGDHSRASKTLALAEKAQGNADVHESIRVLRIYLNALLVPYSSHYASDMVVQLRWLDRQIVNHLSELKHNGDEIILDINGNYSQYYWNDMMRKIVYGAICPKLVANHRGDQALAFANMADNRLLALFDRDEKGTPWIDRYRKAPSFNIHDYRVISFKMADTVRIESLIAYVRTLEHPRTEVDRFLRERSYANPAFFREIIGTRMIREMRYEEAARWLASVPSSFQRGLNTYRDGFFKYDPFSINRQTLKNNADYKYTFAREMVSLEKEIASTIDDDRKAQLMVKLAAGMKNSVTDSWALSFYRKNSEDTEPAADGTLPLFLKAQDQVLAKAFSLFDEALATAETNETKAEILLTYGDIKTLMNLYPETTSAAFAQSHCDTYFDYHLDRYYKRQPWN